jgi:hypothetical protein
VAGACGGAAVAGPWDEASIEDKAKISEKIRGRTAIGGSFGEGTEHITFPSERPSIDRHCSAERRFS